MRMCVWRTTSSPSVVNVIRRCLPFDSTAFTVPPTTCRRAAAGVILGATSSNPVTTRPASARRSTVAVRRIVSPSGIRVPLRARDAPEITARRPGEAGLAERVRGRAEAGHEVAPTNAARILHGLQDPVRRGEAAAGPFRPYDLPCDDAVPLEGLADLGSRALGRCHRCVPGGVGEGPSSGDIVSHGEALKAAHVHRPAGRRAAA